MASITLQDCVEAMDAKDFAKRLAQRVQALPAGALPLQIGCRQGGRVDDHDIATTVLGVDQQADQVVARVGVFFTELVGGCNCNDDPVEVNAYCVLRVSIERATGIAHFEPETG